MSSPQDFGSTLVVRDLGVSDYEAVWTAMREFTAHRTPNTPDEFWLTEHRPVFTLGQAARVEHVLLPDAIPVIRTDRGGQVTYHGPGQVVGYVLFNLSRMRLKVHELVRRIENSMIGVLCEFGIDGARWPGRPGVFAGDSKIGAVGLRIKRGYSYHGLSLNVCMDLTPFGRINPCGMKDLPVTQIADMASACALEDVRKRLVRHVCREFAFTGMHCKWDTLGSEKAAAYALPCALHQ